MKKIFREKEIEDIFRRYRPPINEVFKNRLKRKLFARTEGLIMCERDDE